MDDKDPTVAESIKASIETLTAEDTTPVPTPAPAPTPADPVTPAQTTADPEKTVTPGTPVPTPAPVSEPALRAPQSWKPDMRERWSTLPREVQTEVLRREREIGVGLQSASESRKFQEEFQKTVSPYQAHIAATSGDAMKSFGLFLNTASLLRTGTPQEKARALAGAIAEYGVDVTMLDSFLSAQMRGQIPSPQPQQQQPKEFRDPRVDELLQLREQELQSTTAEEIATFAGNAKNEFFGDVRETVADLLEFNANRGVKMSLQQAYDRACAMEPSIQATLEGRKVQTLAANQVNKVAKARYAASMTTPGKAAPASGTGKAAQSVGDDIRASIEHLSSV